MHAMLASDWAVVETFEGDKAHTYTRMHTRYVQACHSSLRCGGHSTWRSIVKHRRHPFQTTELHPPQSAGMPCHVGQYVVIGRRAQLPLGSLAYHDAAHDQQLRIKYVDYCTSLLSFTQSSLTESQYLPRPKFPQTHGKAVLKRRQNRQCLQSTFQTSLKNSLEIGAVATEGEL